MRQGAEEVAVTVRSTEGYEGPGMERLLKPAADANHSESTERAFDGSDVCVKDVIGSA